LYHLDVGLGPGPLGRVLVFANCGIALAHRLLDFTIGHVTTATGSCLAKEFCHLLFVSENVVEFAGCAK
jgi:hypothetical protein